MKLTVGGYVRKVRAALEKYNGERVAVITTGEVLHFVRAKHIPDLIAVYDRNAEDEWIEQDALSIGLRE